MKPMTVEQERKERNFFRKWWWFGLVIVLLALPYQIAVDLYAPPIFHGSQNIFYMGGAGWIFTSVGYLLRATTELRLRKSGFEAPLEELDAQMGDSKPKR